MSERNAMHPAGRDAAQSGDEFDHLLKTYSIPSLSACIIKRDSRGVWHIAWRGAYGYRSAVWPRLKANTDTIYAIASITKVFTAAAVVRMSETGLLSLDDDVNAHLPFRLRNTGLQKEDPGVRHHAITVRHLLSHRSGLPASTPEFFTSHRILSRQDFGVFAGTREMERYFSNPESWAHRSTAAPGTTCFYAPGERFCYSNTGYILLGVMMEHILNRNWKSYVVENIIEPLGMRRTKFYWDFMWKFGNEAHGYLEKPYVEIPDQEQPPGTVGPRTILAPRAHPVVNPTLIGARYTAGGPAGQMLSTATDLAYFMTALLNGGAGYARDERGGIRYGHGGTPVEVRILSETGVREMQHIAGDPLPAEPDDLQAMTGLNRLTGYGLGWARSSLGGRYWKGPWRPNVKADSGPAGPDAAALSRLGVRRDAGGGIVVEGHSGDTYCFHSAMYRVAGDAAVIYLINTNILGENRDESRMQPRRFARYSTPADAGPPRAGLDGGLPHNLVKLAEIEHLLFRLASAL